MPSSAREGARPCRRLSRGPAVADERLLGRRHLSRRGLQLAAGRRQSSFADYPNIAALQKRCLLAACRCKGGRRGAAALSRRRLTAPTFWMPYPWSLTALERDRPQAGPDFCAFILRGGSGVSDGGAGAIALSAQANPEARCVRQKYLHRMRQSARSYSWMSNTSNLVLPYLAVGRAQKHVTVNESLRKLDALVQLSVVSATTAAEPSSPADGAVYIVPLGESGTHWGGLRKLLPSPIIAMARGQRLPRARRWLAFVRDSDQILHYTGSAWALFCGRQGDHGLRDRQGAGPRCVWSRGGGGDRLHRCGAGADR